MSAFYSTFFMIAPSAVIVLWASGKKAEAREVLLGVILCFYTVTCSTSSSPRRRPASTLESLGMFTVNLAAATITNFQQP